MEIKRTTGKSISIQVHDSKKPIRLEGEIYNEHLRPSREFKEEGTARQTEFDRQRDSRIEENRVLLNKLNSRISEKRSVRYKKKLKNPFKLTQENDSSTVEKEQEVQDINVHAYTLIGNGDNGIVHHDIDVRVNIRRIREKLSCLQQVPCDREYEEPKREDTSLQNQTLIKQSESEKDIENEYSRRNSRTFNTKLRIITVAIRAAINRVKSTFDSSRAQFERERTKLDKCTKEKIQRAHESKLCAGSNDRITYDRTAKAESVQNMRFLQNKIRSREKGFEL